MRLLEPFESFRIQGWDDSQWVKIPSTQSASTDFVELCSNMTGNSYSVFHAGPWILATVCTWALCKLGEPPVAQPDAVHIVGSDSDDDAESLSSA